MLSDLPDSTSANVVGADAIAIERMAHTFALLSDPTRLRVLRTVLEYGEASVGGIAGVARISRFNASAHLNRLARGGLLRRRRVASTVYYQADDQKLRDICDSLLEVLRHRVRYRIG